MHSPYPKILAIIPCYNESGALGSLLEECRRLDFPLDTLVIDDGSHDNSVDIARNHSLVLQLGSNHGVAFVIREGLEYALARGYDYCIQLDGDGQHIPAEIRHFLPGGCMIP